MSNGTLIGVGLFALLAVYCAYLEMALSGARRNVEALQTAADANEKALAEAKAELIRLDGILLEREAEINAIEDRATILNDRLRKATAKGSNAENWANTALPDDIARLFTGADSQNGNNQSPSAASLTSTPARARVDGKNK